MLDIDFRKLAEEGTPAEKLAQVFLQAYCAIRGVTFPINPFLILRDMGIAFSFSNFKKYEGVYIPAEDVHDIPIVGINVNKPVTRQRFTAAHELCHHLKDSGKTFVCAPRSQSKVERYAESFAAEILMPTGEVRKQIKKYQADDIVDFEGVLSIAEYFGVSFQACLNKLAYQMHAIDGDISPASLKQRRTDFKPAKKRIARGYNDVLLYEQLFDAADNYLNLDLSSRIQQFFKAQYIAHDSRMEGINVDDEVAGEILMDLRLHGKQSKYCTEKEDNLIEVLGLGIVYDYVFDIAKEGTSDIGIYNIKQINKKLFSFAPCSECAGEYRNSNALVFGASFETMDSKHIPEEMIDLDKKIEELCKNESNMMLAAYIESVLEIHHLLTVIHPFVDGNGRTARAFTNLMLVRKGLPPVLFDNESKNAYKKALAKTDKSKDCSALFELYFKQILKSYAGLSPFSYDQFTYGGNTLDESKKIRDKKF